MHRAILAALLLPSLAAAQQGSQASYLQYKQCLASALQMSDHSAAQANITKAQSKCTTQRARLSADVYQGLRAEGRPESMSRRLAADTVDTLETRIRDQLVGESQDTP